MSRPFKIIFVLLFCTCFTFSSVGQKQDSTKTKFYLWLSAGSGLTYSGNFDLMFNGRYAINSSINQKYYMTFLYQYNRFYYWEYFFYSGKLPNELIYNNNFSALFGIGKYKYKSLAFIASTGISFGEGSYRGNAIDSTQDSFDPNSYDYEYEFDNFNYFGLPLNFKILVDMPIAGLSLDLYANIHKHMDYGIILNINLGKIRDRKK